MSSLFSNRATIRLMNSLPLSEWKPRMRKGNCRIRAHSTGSSQASLMRSVAATISPLRDLIHRVDVVDAFAGGGIALVHGVQSQEAGLTLRIGTAPFADGGRGGSRPSVGETAFPIARLLPQVIEVGHRNPRQPLILGLAVLAVFPLENTARGGTAQVLVGLIDGGQQFEVGASIALRKAMTPVRRGL